MSDQTGSVRCHSCGTPSSGEALFCSACGSSLTDPSLYQTVAVPTTPSREGSQGTDRPRSGSVSGIHSGRSTRFAPGTILAGRYRIVGLLGKGGMGEVYRADDLTLDQSVALKFLPEAVASHPDRLARFHAEVRLARSVTHPNVCRVHDISEADGLQFLTMEYVDGEDLASLLRRIGRVERDKALEIARQLCAGIAAAHKQGVLHRDLKPANVMLDGEGKVRITDFGLAAIASEIDPREARSGTPAYMSPEQLAGGTVSERSDLYALGLVLYELFTGKAAFKADTLQEIDRLQRTTTPESPSSLVRDLDPAVERVILRCLEKEASRRPATALAVAAALPGGDPLAAALAAGETPSPELVANAAESEGIGVGRSWVLLLTTLLLMAGYCVISGPVGFPGRFPAAKQRAILSNRAAELLEQFGPNGQPGDRAEGYSLDGNFILAQISGRGRLDQWQQMAELRPSPLYFWQRQGPNYLDPEEADGRVRWNDPAQQLEGMARVRIDSQGRLIRLEVVPPQRVGVDSTAFEPIDWNEMFDSAGLDFNQFEPIAPVWIPSSYADTMLAWRGVVSGQERDTLRVDAALLNGGLTEFHVVAPWTRPPRIAGRILPRSFRVAEVVAVLLVMTALFGGLWVMRRNLKLGRGDWRGALRIAAVVLFSNLAGWVLTAHHSYSPSDLFNNFVLILAVAGFQAAFLWMLYVALEPYVRRRWPWRIVSWSCLLTGRYRDPLVGRDILIGAVFGLGALLLDTGHLVLSERFGQVGTSPFRGTPLVLLGARQQIGLMFEQVPQVLTNALILLFVPVFLLMLVRKQWLAIGIFALVLSGIFAARTPDVPIGPIVSVLQAVLFIFVTVRYGLLPLAVCFLYYFWLLLGPVTFSLSSIYTPLTWISLTPLLVLTAYAFRIALGDRFVMPSQVIEE